MRITTSHPAVKWVNPIDLKEPLCLPVIDMVVFKNSTPEDRAFIQADAHNGFMMVMAKVYMQHEAEKKLQEETCKKDMLAHTTLIEEVKRRTNWLVGANMTLIIGLLVALAGVVAKSYIGA